MAAAEYIASAHISATAASALTAFNADSVDAFVSEVSGITQAEVHQATHDLWGVSPVSILC